MDQLSEDQKPELHEVADLMLEIYQILAKMRYIDASEIVQGPHDLTETLSHDDDGETILGLDPSIKYLYTILPYVMSTRPHCNYEFFGRSTFANFTDREHIAQMRKPWAGRMESIREQMEEGRWIHPFVTPLALFGDDDEDTMIIYGSRSHQIWLLNVEDWKCKDLALEGVETPADQLGMFLRDIVQWYRELKVLPGGGENDDIDWTHYRKDLDLKELYRKHGWPDNFDGDAFEVDMARSYAAHSAKKSAQQPLKDLQWCQEVKANVEKHLLEQEKAVDATTNKEDAWYARYRIWQATQDIILRDGNLLTAQETAQRLCPNGVCQKEEDLPLWEVKFLRQAHKIKQHWVLQREKWVQDAMEGDRCDRNNARTALKYAKRKEAIYRRALEQSQADADRLCPGRTFQSATGLDPDRPFIMGGPPGGYDAYVKTKLESAQQWLLTVPSDIVKAREYMSKEIFMLEEQIRKRERAKTNQGRGLLPISRQR
ncbi:hypothetical protein DPV78_012223 [Talaromyces pinophilus]|nr:hypothetical protein DPV78_012223 [Talaromyces pinophilus]